jgi:hypothetical protein
MANQQREGGGPHREEHVEEHVPGHGQVLVDVRLVHGEAVEDAAHGGGVEEGHGRAQDGREDALVQDARRPQAQQEEAQGADVDEEGVRKGEGRIHSCKQRSEVR